VERVHARRYALHQARILCERAHYQVNAPTKVEQLILRVRVHNKFIHPADDFGRQGRGKRATNIKA
jgi:hypothetical protein